jgi:hypothetical protein
MEKLKKNINEDALENILLVTGFVPIVGEVADLILIGRYVIQKRYIEAGLMLVALIPTVGDIIVKPFIFLAKGTRAFKSGKNLLGFLSKNPKAKALFIKIGDNMNHPKIIKLIEQVTKKSPALGRLFTKSKNSITSVLAALKSGTKVTPAKVGGIGKAIKRTSRAKAIHRYRAKFGAGVTPKTALSKWWHFNYKAGLGRRNFIKKIIIGNSFLAALGIYNFEDLQKIFSNEKLAEQYANNDEFNDFLDQTNTPEEFERMRREGGSPQPNQSSQKQSGGLGDIGYAALIPVLKKAAGMFV